jgi:hypothetical protein
MPEAAATAGALALRVHDARTLVDALNGAHAPAPGELWVAAKQAAFVEDQTPYVALVGGIGSGKTRAGVIKALLTMERHPGVLGVVTAPTIAMLDTTVRAFRELLPQERYAFHRSLPRRIVLDNGSEVIFRTTDEPDRLRGPNLAFVYMDEAALSSEEAFRVLQGRLRQRVPPSASLGEAPYRHQLWLTTTPKGHNWVYREFAARQASPSPRVPFLRPSSPSSPLLVGEALSRAERGIDGRAAAAERPSGEVRGSAGRSSSPHNTPVLSAPSASSAVVPASPDYALHRLSARDNPFLPASFVPRLERDYQGEFAAQEIEGEFVAVGNKPYFSVEATAGLLHDCRPAVAKRGLVQVWEEPDPEGRYVVGADVAWGEKGSYSCAVSPATQPQRW